MYMKRILCENVVKSGEKWRKMEQFFKALIIKAPKNTWMVIGGMGKILSS